MAIVVEQLVLRAGGEGVRQVRFLGYVEEHAAVPVFRDAPLEREVEARVLVHRDEVAGLGDTGNRAVDDLPPVGRGLLFPAAPPIEGLAIEEQLPAVLRLLSRQR